MNTMWQWFSLLLDIILPRRGVEEILGKTTPELFAERATFRRTGEVWAPFSYNDTQVRALILEAKFHGNEHAAAFLGKAAACAVEDILMEECALLTRPLLIIPIPLHRNRERERGFNQAERIARSFAESIRVRVEVTPHLLIRSRNTPPQTKMENRYAREQNMFRAFEAVLPELLRERTILLIDDVTTTGSTLKEAGRALRDGGAERVILLAVAEA